MADTVMEKLLERMQTGVTPWRVFGSELVALNDWFHYEHPLVGTMLLSNDVVLFFQQYKEEGALSVWKYTPMDLTLYDMLMAGDGDMTSFQSVESMRVWINENIDGAPENLWALAEDLEVLFTWL